MTYQVVIISVHGGRNHTKVVSMLSKKSANNFYLVFLFFSIMCSVNHVKQGKFGDRLLDGQDVVRNGTKYN